MLASVKNGGNVVAAIPNLVSSFSSFFSFALDLDEVDVGFVLRIFDRSSFGFGTVAV